MLGRANKKHRMVIHKVQYYTIYKTALIFYLQSAPMEPDEKWRILFGAALPFERATEELKLGGDFTVSYVETSTDHRQ